MKSIIIKIIVKLLSKLNRRNKRDILEKIEYLIFLANGKNRGSYTIDHEVDTVVELLHKSKAEEGGVVIDVGANYGNYTQRIYDIFPNLEYFLFEPQKEIFEKCLNNFESQKNVKIYNFGLFSENIKKMIYKNETRSKSSQALGKYPRHGLASFYERKHEINEGIKYDFKKSDLLELKRFDDLGLEIDKIRFLKIDVEGAELEVLKGFGSYLNKTHLIQFEWGRTQLDSKNSFLEYWELLSKYGFDIYRIHPGGIKKIIKYSWLKKFILLQTLYV
jgi:FkbM family methyltransferase